MKIFWSAFALLAIMSACVVEPEPVLVLAATRDLPAERILAAGDLKTVAYPADLVGPGFVQQPEKGLVVGQRLLVPLTWNSPLLHGGLAPVEAATSAEAPSKQVRMSGRIVQVPMLGADNVQPQDHLDVVQILEDPKTEKRVAILTRRDLIVHSSTHQIDETGEPIWHVALSASSEQAEELELASRLGTIHAVLRPPNALVNSERTKLTTFETIIIDKMAGHLCKKRKERLEQDRPKNPGGKTLRAERDTSARLSMGLRSVVLSARGAALVSPGDRVDVIVTLSDPKVGGILISATILEGLEVLAAEPNPKEPDRSRVTLAVLPEEAPIAILADRLGWIGLAVRHPADKEIECSPYRTTIETLITGESLRSFNRSKGETIEIVR